MARRKLWLAGGVGVVVAAAAAAVVVWQASDDRSSPLAARPAPNVALEQLVEAVGGESASVSAAGYRYLKKLDSSLVDVAASRLGGDKTDAAAAADRQGVTTSPAGDVLVDVYVTTDIAQAERALRALGMRVTGTSDIAPQRMVEGYLPAAALPEAAKLPGTRAVLSTVVGMDSGGTLSQGDAAIRGPAARALGATGTGVASASSRTRSTRCRAGSRTRRRREICPRPSTSSSIRRAGPTRDARWPRSSSTRPRASVASHSRPAARALQRKRHRSTAS